MIIPKNALGVGVRTLHVKLLLGTPTFHMELPVLSSDRFMFLIQFLIAVLSTWPSSPAGWSSWLMALDWQAKAVAGI